MSHGLYTFVSSTCTNITHQCTKEDRNKEVKNQAHDIVYSKMAGSLKYKFDPNE